VFLAQLLQRKTLLPNAMEPRAHLIVILLAGGLRAGAARLHSNVLANIVADWSVSMLSAHITSFLNLIGAQLEEICSNHHFHNVQCGIANILSLLKYSNDVGEKADELSRTASDYITHHDVIRVYDNTDDADRLHAAHEALAGFRFAVEHSEPKARVRTLGLS
jgi:hypothetical protein